jgi:hypothetical protein
MIEVRQTATFVRWFKRATRISRSTIVRGIQEAKAGATLGPERTRKLGGGRKKATDKDPTLRADLETLVEPTASGDPQSPLRWTSKSVRRLLSSGLLDSVYMASIYSRWCYEGTRPRWV